VPTPTTAAGTSESPFLGLACRVAAAACAFACCASGRRAAQQRASGVARRMHPSACHKPKQKVLRRLEPYGQIPAWSRKALVKRRLKQPWRTRNTPKPSAYGRGLIEKQRVRYHYNIKNYQLKNYMIESFKKGIEYPVDHLLQILESRLDNFVWRVGLAPTMACARWFVRGGHVQYQRNGSDKWITCNLPKCRLKIGDKVRVKPKKTSQNTARLKHEDEGPVDLPAHIRWDRDTLEGEYLDICDWQDFGLHVEIQYFLYLFTGQEGVRRTHHRYFEGTRRIIKKLKKGCGRIRPTPENILNMERGLGLNLRGRSRPPCLWGRKKPVLNNPYEVSRRFARGM